MNIFPETKKIEIDDEGLILGYFDMLEMAVTNDDYDTADFVCEEIQKYSYPENICKQVEKLVEKVNALDSEEAVKIIEVIKENW